MTRGVTIITFAKAWFLIAGFALTVGLARMLGTSQFGLYSVVTSLVSVLNNVLIAATLQAVSRFTARDPDRAGSVLRAGLAVQAVIGLSLFALLELLSPLVGRWLRDPTLVTPLRVVALVVPAYALYAVNVGFFNGRRRFAVQGVLDCAYSTLRVSLTLGAVAIGLGVTGAVGGFAAAAFTILAVSTLLVRREPRPRGPFDTRELLGFGGWLFLLTAFANLVLHADLWVVKGMTDPAAANEAAGLYKPAVQLAQLLYQLLIPLSLVLFPSLSHLGRDPDPAAARGMVRGALRYLAVTVVPGAALLAAMGPELITLLFGSKYRLGGEALGFLGPAYALWTGAYVLATALSGAGAPRVGVAVLAAGFAAQVVACPALFPALGLRGIALGDALAMGAAFALGLVLATRRFGSIVPWWSVLRGLALALGLGMLAKLWPAAGPMVALKGGCLALVAVAVLLASGELRVPPRLLGKGIAPA